MISRGEGTILKHDKGAVVPLRGKKRCSRTIEGDLHRSGHHSEAWERCSRTIEMEEKVQLHYGPSLDPPISVTHD